MSMRLQVLLFCSPFLVLLVLDVVRIVEALTR